MLGCVVQTTSVGLDGEDIRGLHPGTDGALSCSEFREER